MLGEDSRAVLLRDLGLSEVEVEDLITAGVVGAAGPAPERGE